MGGTYYDDEEVALIRAAQGGDIAARNTLIERHIGLICMHTKRVVGDEYVEYLSYAFEGAANTIRKFRPEMGFKLTTPMGTAVMRHVLRASQRSRVIRVPSEKAGRTAKRFVFERAACGRGVFSIDAECRNTGRKTQLAARAELETPATDELQLLNRYLARLQPRLREIVELRARGVTLAAVGAQFGMTRERVRQLQREAHRKLRFFAGAA